MKYKHLLLCTIIGVFSGMLFSYAQDSIQQLPAIVVKARDNKDKIVLRWGVNDKNAWKYSNEYGYIIERITVLRDGKPLVNPEHIVLTQTPLKPQPLEAWKPYIEKNDHAAVVAQALYGEDFEMDDEGQQNQVLRIIQETEELDRRFAFAMFVMDQDFEVAQMAGLGYVDTNVKPNEKYLYQIKSAVPKDIMDIRETGVFISPAEAEELPPPMDFVGFYYKQSFLLVWEYDRMLPYYTSYNLKRSSDGITYEKVNKSPITKLADTQQTTISYVDSIAEFNKKYWYRLTGISVFGEKGKPSDPVELFGFKGIKTVPLFKENVILSDTEVLLEWEFPKEEEGALKQFDLFRADKAIGPYVLVKEAIPGSERSYRYDKVQSINYFKLKAIGRNGEYIFSPPNMVQPVDSVAPVKPVGLTGTIDTLGVVKLTWQANLEPDLRGYKIFRADRPNQEFTMLNKYSVDKPEYTDTINVTTFAKNVYYRIAALDQRYNQSDYSEVLKLKRPDKIPPTSPVIDSYEQRQDGIALKWIKSSSSDVAKEILYRKIMGNGSDLWEKIYETETDTTAYYLDTKIEPGGNYYYTLVAVDQSGLESPPSPPLALDVVGTLLRPAVKGLYTRADRDNKLIRLYWRYKESDVLEFLIYKKKKGGKFILFRTAGVDDRQLIDNELDINTIYDYGIKAVFKDGSTSKWNEVEVEY